MLVVGCTGHRSLPPRYIPYIRGQLRSVLGGLDRDFVGVSCLAAGADQLFANVVLECGGRLRVVLPCTRYASSLDEDEYRGYRQLLPQADGVEVLGYEHPTGEVYLAGGRHVVRLADMVVAVWDGQPARGVGGTGDVVAYARTVDKPLVVIWPKENEIATADR